MFKEINDYKECLLPNNLIKLSDLDKIIKDFVKKKAGKT